MKREIKQVNPIKEKEKEIIRNNLTMTHLDEGKPYVKKKWYENLFLYFFKSRSFLIRMQLRNGMFRSFLIYPSGDSFKFQKGTYIIDTTFKYFDVDRDSWVLDYHQDLTLPVRRNIFVPKLMDKIKSSDDIEVEHSANPTTLQNFLVAKIAEGVMRGQAIDEFLKGIKIMMIITMVAAVGHLILFVFKSGILNSISIPGLF